MEVKGKKSFSFRRNFILASNHISNLDPIVLGIACPHRLAFIAKEELFKNKLFASFLKILGVIPLRRGKRDIRVIRSALDILKEKPLVIFPQGRRSETYDKFMPGVGFLYKRTNLPIIAAKIYGTDKVFPKGAKFIRRGKIKVVFDKLKGINSNSIEEITSKVREKIISL
jgi:1-acyl-sn-glycerol-3-phosphate acyltransferase